MISAPSPCSRRGTRVRGALLQALARLEQPVTRRQLAAAAGVAPGNASAVIGEFIRAGRVSETVAGRSSMVVLNRSHLAAGLVLALAGLRCELIRRLRERLSAWPGLNELHADVRTWTGNDLQLVEHSSASWRRLVRARNPLVEQIRLERIALTGDAGSLLERHR